MSSKPLNHSQFRLEAELQSELHFAGTESAGRLAKGASSRFVGCPSTCGCENEVRAIENVKGSRIELQVKPFRYFEDLGQGHIRGPVAWTDERVTTQVAGAGYASRPGEYGQVRLVRSAVVRFAATPDRAGIIPVRIWSTPAIRPHVAAETGEARHTAIRPVIPTVVQVEVTTFVHAQPGGNPGRRAIAG